MNRPLLLDLFCGAGGAAMGYHRAGFDVVGVDIEPQRDYPFPFVQGDALEPPLDLARFDVIHASPPCQAVSRTRHAHNVKYPRLIEPTRELLVATGLPYVIENVEDAALVEPITLCGASFDLTAVDVDGVELVLKRHRKFESNVALLTLPCLCLMARRAGFRVGGVYTGVYWSGKGAPVRDPNAKRKCGYVPPRSIQQQLMGADWMTDKQLAESIPPAYTEFIGRQLIPCL